MSDYRQAVLNVYADSVNTIGSDDSIDWLDGHDTTPEETDNINIELVRIARGSVFLPISEQLDQIYWDRKNGTNTWEEGIDAIKTKYPKG